MRNKTTMGLGVFALNALALAGFAPQVGLTVPGSSVEVLVETAPGMFPESWVEDPIQAKATSLEPDQAERSLRLVKAALAQYPETLLKRELKRVYVCRSIRFYGLEYGGTNSLDTVYLTNQGPAKGYTDEYIQGSFHHEFSSILLRNHLHHLDQAAWSRHNPEGFKYGAGGTDALRNGRASTKYEGALAERGFLTQYSQASLEEDFNMIAEGLFSGSARFWELFDEHERVRSKIRLVVAFYSKLDSKFGEVYFRGLASETAQSD